MKALGAMAGVLLLGGCASLQPAPACPTGQAYLHTAQLYFGHAEGDGTQVSEAAFRKFVDEELTPRFPDGLTVLDGGGRWKGDENKAIREASKVVLIVLPRSREAQGKVDAVRAAYKARFHQDSTLQLTQPACVSL